MNRMRRREFLALIGGMAVAGQPGLGQARQARKLRRIAVLLGAVETDPEAQSRVGAFRQELERLGWIDGRNLRIDQRWTGGDVGRLRAYVADLVASAPDVILANPTPNVAALKEATRTIPIVFALVSDPVSSGFVASWVRPGGNITGFTNFEPSLAGKWLQALEQMAPTVRQVALVFNPDTAASGGAIFVRAVEQAAPPFGLTIKVAPVRSAAEIAGLAAGEDAGLLILPDLFTTNHRDEIIALAAQRRLPALYPFRFFAASGGLMSYGIDTHDVFRRAASSVDRILKGAKAGELPVEGPVKLELVINLKTARALGLTVPPSLLALADEVIE